jgi:4'-phosphopantetheinyl transferase
MFGADVYWREQSESGIPAGDDWLTPRERERASGLRCEKRRRDWRLGRWTAKTALAVYWRLPSDCHTLAGLEIRPAASGAPLVFLDDEPATVAISLSHRSGRAVCAVAPAGTALGCDLEFIEPRTEAFAADYFTAEEQSLVRSASISQRAPLLALLWSGKESALKALGEGLRLDTRSVNVQPAGFLHPVSSEQWHSLSASCNGSQVFHGWWHADVNFVRTLLAVPPPAYFVSQIMPG